MKTAWIGGGNGFIGHHLARRLKSEGYWVRVVDIQEYRYGNNDYADDIVIGDLRDPKIVESSLRLQVTEHDVPIPYSFLSKPFLKTKPFDEIYQFAADMGGAQYIFTGAHDADIMANSAIININVVTWAHLTKAKKIFYSSSACIYPQELQTSFEATHLKESDAYPANPDSDYGWEKLFSERLYLAWGRNYQLNCMIARFHNIYGPEGTWYGGKEKAPAAVCRKVVKGSEFVENWGNGKQTRTFLYIDDCIDAIRLVMDWDINNPINIGSEEVISIQDLYQMVIDISGKNLKIKNIPMPEGCMGVAGRSSDNTMIKKITGWEPKYTLRQGLEKTYQWIKSQYENS